MPERHEFPRGRVLVLVQRPDGKVIAYDGQADGVLYEEQLANPEQLHLTQKTERLRHEATVTIHYPDRPHTYAADPNSMVYEHTDIQAVPKELTD
jgi:hypothetical protein